MSCIEENNVVLLRKNDIFKPACLTKGRRVNFDKISFLPDVAIGLPFGTSFEVTSNGSLIPQLLKEDQQDQEETLLQVIAEHESAKDNRKIIDDGSAQKLSYDEIHAMKRQGLSGQEILESVVQGSASFKDRTKFSQEKYVKKKEKKHKHIITIVKPSTRLLCQMYYAKGPSKICHLRLDTLSQMLTLGNIHAHSNVVVMETCQGLLTGAVLERLGGYGQLVQVFFGDLPVRSALESFGHLTEQDMSVLLQYPLHRIGQLLKGQISSCEPVELDLLTDDKVTVASDDLEIQADEEQESSDELETGRAAKRRRTEKDQETESADELKERKRKEREEDYQRAASLLLTKQMDGLLIASRFHPRPILMSLIEFVAPSRPIVIYSQFQEPLVQCYQLLKESGKVFNIQLSETWWRHYQVLPGRTHPVVNMDAQSGFLLYGTTLCSS